MKPVHLPLSWALASPRRYSVTLPCLRGPAAGASPVAPARKLQPTWVGPGQGSENLKAPKDVAGWVTRATWSKGCLKCPRGHRTSCTGLGSPDTSLSRPTPFAGPHQLHHPVA